MLKSVEIECDNRIKGFFLVPDNFSWPPLETNSCFGSEKELSFVDKHVINSSRRWPKSLMSPDRTGNRSNSTIILQIFDS